MLRISNVKMPLNFTMEDLKRAAGQSLAVDSARVLRAALSKKSVDARDKGDVHFVVSIDAEIAREESLDLSRLPRGVSAAFIQKRASAPERPRASLERRPLVVGLGPAGLFAALTLAQAGLRPLVVERGRDVERRARDVQSFWNGGALDEESNVQFGEGGAGAFSDGKLNTGISDPRCRAVLEALLEAGAPEEILFMSKPHIGTDKLPRVVKSIRQQILRLGGEVLFEHKLTRLHIEAGCVRGAMLTDLALQREMQIQTDHVLLCIGHSARDTFESLFSQGVPMSPKAFSIGARIEHRQSLIDRAQYGAFAGHPALGAAEYRLNARLKDGRGAYTFCMCPGGQVVAAASERGMVVTNGMSAFARDLENANSALLIGIEPADYGDGHPLSGLRFQRVWERAAFEAGGGDYSAPAQLVGDFLKSQPSTAPGGVQPSYRPGVRFGSLDACLPPFVLASMRQAIVQLDRSLKGFAAPDAVLTGVETRSSSPLRIPRDEHCQSAVGGLIPSGEGAGYAGGILSAAVDGIRCAEALIDLAGR